ncbi:MAG TPA: heme-binding protein [Thermoleophilaceae bacterium]|nr:heme-binding protein [Thermoleophilaceae bacterium]
MRTRRTIDIAGADAVLAAAEAKAKHTYARVFIAVVDPDGELVALRRTPGAQVASARVSVDKARTAAIFIRPSRELEEQASNGRLGALALHGAAALTGGIPLRVDGQVVGAIGTSGETPDEDEAVSLAGATADFSTSEERVLTFEGARIAGEAVARECEARAVAPVAAIVDTNGELIYVYRPDKAQVASVGVAADKARTAAIYRRESRDFEEQVAGGRRPSALHLARAVPLQGGIPIVIDGEVVGAVGVSGATSADEDRELAQIGVAAAEAAATTRNGHASYFPGAAVRQKFETGGLLLEKPHYKIDAGRRTGPGDVEIHDREVDVMHVLQGSATVVAGEETHKLGEGDVLEIPAGVPHQFTDATDPFLYFVVKVAS